MRPNAAQRRLCARCDSTAQLLRARLVLVWETPVRSTVRRHHKTPMRQRSPMAVFLLLALPLALLQCRPQPVAAGTPPVEQMTTCVDRISKQVQAAGNTHDALWDAAGLCQTMIEAQRVSDEQLIRADSFVFQRGENTVLMWMVVIITVAGVALAGVQLWASYKLALAGRGELVQGGSVDLSKDRLAVQSSVVGVIVLGISFAFFLVFVLFVYTIQNGDQPKNQGPATMNGAPHQISSGPLQPLPSAMSPSSKSSP
jgi:hypothetical protein